jgi:hypothetical protein
MQLAILATHLTPLASNGFKAGPWLIAPIIIVIAIIAIPIYYVRTKKKKDISS